MLLLRLTRGLLIALIGFSSALLHQSRAQTPPLPSDAAPDLVVLTYNVLKDNSRYTDIAAVIRSSGADVVLIQEVNAYFERTVVASLSDLYPHSIVRFMRPDRLALAILSKTPLGNANFSVFSDEASRLRAEIRVNERTVILYNVHLPNPTADFLRGQESAQHNRAIAALLRLIDAEPRAPLLIAGDFNMLPNGSAHERLLEHFTDAFAQAGVGANATYPANTLLPALLRIDYIFHSSAWIALDARVLPDAGGSDHHPLIAALALPPE